LKNDKTIVLVAVKNNGDALRFASKILQDDEKIVLESVKIMENHYSLLQKD